MLPADSRFVVVGRTGPDQPRRTHAIAAFDADGYPLIVAGGSRQISRPDALGILDYVIEESPTTFVTPSKGAEKTEKAKD